METPLPISKQEAIAAFDGDVGALATALNITRSAIYQWPDDEPIPHLQAMRLRYEVAPQRFAAPRKYRRKRA